MAGVRITLKTSAGLTEIDRRLAGFNFGVLTDPTVSAARTACVLLATYTWPNEETRYASRITSEIMNLFSAGELYQRLERARGKEIAGAFWRLYKKGDAAGVRRLIARQGFSLKVRAQVPEAEYQAARGPLGRVRRSDNMSTVVLDDAAIKRFAKNGPHKRIGAAAAAWLAAGEKLATNAKGRFQARGVQKHKLLGRHGRYSRKRGSVQQFGSAAPNGQMMINQIKIYNDYDYIDHVCPPHIRDKAADIALDRMRKAIKIALEKEAKRSVIG